MTTPLTISALDAMPGPAFSAALSDLFEHSPWIIQAIAPSRPFGTAQALHDAAMAAIHAAPPETQRALLRAHPELAGKEADTQTLTLDSASEQHRLGFTSLSPAEHAELAALNAAYRTRFGVPCIVALCRHTTRDTVFQTIRARLAASPETEHQTALLEVAHVTQARLAARLGHSQTEASPRDSIVQSHNTSHRTPEA